MLMVRVANDCSLYAEIKVGDKAAFTIRSLDRGDMKMDLICVCGHKHFDHCVDADLLCEDQLIKSGGFYACQAEGCMCEEFEEDK